MVGASSEQARQESQRLTDAEDIYRAIRALQLQRSLLTVTLQGERVLGSSLVLDTQLERQRFVIDQVTPGELHDRLAIGGEITLRANYGGVQVNASCRILAIVRSGGYQAVELAFPAFLLHRQRRASYRTQLPPGEHIAIQLHSKRRAGALPGQITDLSMDGLGVSFDQFVKPPIEPGEQFHACEFSIDGHALSVALEAKHPHYHRHLDKYHCGFSFLQLSNADARHLNRLAVQIQREVRRRESARKRPPLLPIS